MKNILKNTPFILLFTLFTVSCGSMVATVIPADDFKTEKIVELPNKTKDALFIKTNDWMVSAFNNAESVIQFTDKTEGTIIGKYLLSGNIGYTSFGAAIDTRIYAKITVQVKPNKARIIIVPSTDVNIYNEAGKTAITEKINGLIKDFEVSLQTKSNTDW